MARQKLSVLFLCTGNSARSQMAEALLRHMSKGRIDVDSAGSDPRHEIHPMARQAVRRFANLDMVGQHPKSVDQFAGRNFDYVFTLCDRAAELCPSFPGDPEKTHWRFDDPSALEDGSPAQSRAFERVAQELVARMRIWMVLPGVRNRLDEVEGPA